LYSQLKTALPDLASGFVSRVRRHLGSSSSSDTSAPPQSIDQISLNPTPLPRASTSSSFGSNSSHQSNLSTSRRLSKPKFSLSLSSVLPYTLGVPYRGFNKKETYAASHMVSLSERTANKLLKERDGPGGIVKHSRGRMVRLYPSVTRLTSSNFDPVRYWGVGVQIVAINWQSCGEFFHFPSDSVVWSYSSRLRGADQVCLEPIDYCRSRLHPQRSDVRAKRSIGIRPQARTPPNQDEGGEHPADQARPYDQSELHFKSALPSSMPSYHADLLSCLVHLPSSRSSPLNNFLPFPYPTTSSPPLSVPTKTSTLTSPSPFTPQPHPRPPQRPLSRPRHLASLLPQSSAPKPAPSPTTASTRSGTSPARSPGSAQRAWMTSRSSGSRCGMIRARESREGRSEVMGTMGRS
jgi:hypothetical protein